VTLTKGPQNSGKVTITNNYGDFKIDDLEENSGRYTLRIEYTGYETGAVEVDLTTSRNAGVIFLQPARS
jgi:hypothetical protein